MLVRRCSENRAYNNTYCTYMFVVQHFCCIENISYFELNAQDVPMFGTKELTFSQQMHEQTAGFDRKGLNGLGEIPI